MPSGRRTAWKKVVDKVRALANEAAAASPDVVERTYRAMIAAFIDLELSAHEIHLASAAEILPVTPSACTFGR